MRKFAFLKAHTLENPNLNTIITTKTRSEKQDMIKRTSDVEKIEALGRIFPVVGILGPRQCGKTTLVKQLAADHYFDMENPADLRAFENPQSVLENLSGTVVIDEIQRKPKLFELLRYLVDSQPGSRYIILGSASRELVAHSSESLAGRIGYHYLGGFRLMDVGSENMSRLWLHGAMPKAYTLEDFSDSRLWTNNYITTLLEKDLPSLGIAIPSETMRRFWTMLAHYHGQVLNYSKLASVFGVSDNTVRRYIDILNGTFMTRSLQPWFANTKKRLVKKPKLYIRDSGIFHSLCTVTSQKNLFGSEILGSSWEGFALEQVSKVIDRPYDQMYFWRLHSGAEVDLFWQQHGRNWAVEFKFADAPRGSKSMTNAIDELGLEHLWIVYPGKRRYSISDKITAVGLGQIAESWEYP